MCNFYQKLIEYCQSDVELLRQSVLQFRTLIKSIDPFNVACTAASACNSIYRQLFMPMNAIGILPINGYQSRDATFFSALQWLTWIESQESGKAETCKHKIAFYKSGKTNISNRKVGE